MKKNWKIIFSMVLLIFLSVIYAWGDTAAAIYDKVYDADNSDYKNTGIVWDGTIEQEFVAEENSLNGIMLKTTVSGKVSDITVIYQIMDAVSGKICTEGKVPASDFKNDKFKKIEFDKINVRKGKHYKISLRQENATEDTGIGFYFVPKENTDISLWVRENATNGTVLMRTLTQKFNIERFAVLLVFIIYITVFLKILYKLFK